MALAYTASFFPAQNKIFFIAFASSHFGHSVPELLGLSNSGIASKSIANMWVPNGTKELEENVHELPEQRLTFFLPGKEPDQVRSPSMS